VVQAHAAQKHGGGRLTVSAIIVTVLGLQIVAGFVDTGRWGWPFVAYPMYKRAHYEGERFDHDLTVYLIMDDSSERVVTGPDLGLSFWLVEKRIWNPVRSGNQEHLQSFIEDVCPKFDNRIIAVRLEDKGVALGRSGMVNNLPPGVVGSMPVNCD
jgi:hypothetical protein